MRDYKREYETTKKRDSLIQFRIHKDEDKKFREKLEKEGKTISEFLKEKINEYINE